MVQMRCALLIGVPTYKSESIRDIPVIVNDLELIKNALESSRYEVKTVNPTDPIETTRSGIIRSIRTFCREVPPGSVAVVVLSGHGLHHEGCDYLLPSDAVLEDPEDIKEGLVALDFGRVVDNSPAEIVLFFIDACREGVDLTSKGLERVCWGQGPHNPGTRRYWAMIFGCEPGQLCHAAGEHSLFSQALAEAFLNTNPARTFQEINQSIQRRLQGLTTHHGIRTQAIRLKVESDVLPKLCDTEIADGTKPEVIPNLKLPPVLSRLRQLTPDDTERRYIEMNHDGHFRIQGAPGCGKTVVLIHRALRLAAEQPALTGRIFTITRSLADLIESGVRLLNGSLPANLQVSSLYEFLVDCLDLFGEADRFRLWDDLSGERSATTWNQFFNHPGKKARVNVFAASDIQEFMLRLGGRTLHGVPLDVSRYIRDEVRLIQSACLKNERAFYLEDRSVRKGRGVPLNSDERAICLRVTEAWEEWLRVGHLCDTHGLSLEAAQYIFDERKFPLIQHKMKTDFVLIDEFQDFSTLELRIVNRLLSTSEGTNNLFFAGDCKQAGLIKHHSTVRANLSFQGRSEFIRKNYRNTREIFDAAYSLVVAYPPVWDELSEYLSPVLSDRLGPKPMALKTSVENHVKDVIQIVSGSARPQLAILSENEQFLESVQRELSALGHAVVRVYENDDLDKRDQMNTQPLLDGIVISSLACVKGWEFETVVCCDFSEGSFPDGRAIPESETWRAAATAYTAFTRARSLLFVTYCQKPSLFLEIIRDKLTWFDSVDTMLFHLDASNSSTESVLSSDVMPVIRVDELHSDNDSLPLIQESCEHNADHKMKAGVTVHKCKVLFLAADPCGSSKLALDEEVRKIEQRIRESEHRDQILFKSWWAIRPDDIELALLQEKPHVVHFSGHGSSNNELILKGEDGLPRPVSKEAIVGLFRILRDNIKLVVLNACFSRSQAEGIIETIPCAIGMNRAIGDSAAICFSASLYRGVGYGRSIYDAFELGKNALIRESIPEETTPELLCNQGVDPREIILL